MFFEIKVFILLSLLQFTFSLKLNPQQNSKFSQILSAPQGIIAAKFKAQKQNQQNIDESTQVDKYMENLFEFIIADNDSELEANLIQLEDAENFELNLDEKNLFMCANDIDLITPTKNDSSNNETVCYLQQTPLQVLNSGYWYELCHEIYEVNEQCNKNMNCFVESLTYYSQLYFSQKIFANLKENEKFAQTLFDLCLNEYFSHQEMKKRRENIVEELPFESYNFSQFWNALQVMNVSDMIDDKNFKYDLEGAISIKKDYSFDLQLFFKQEEHRDLFKWGESYDEMEFSQICKLASGKNEKCPIDDYQQDIEGFRTCVEKWLASMKSFNYISESNDARWNLYNICKYQVNLKFDFNEEGEVAYTSVFEERFPEFSYFESLYE